MVKENALNLKMTGVTHRCCRTCIDGHSVGPAGGYSGHAYQAPGVPKTADGKPDLNAPAPRAADGKPDLSGVWETAPVYGLRAADHRWTEPATRARSWRGSRSRIIDAPRRRLGGSWFGNVGAQVDGGAPYQPWAADLVKKRMADNSKDNPDAHCLPMGIMQLTSHPYPKKNHPDACRGHRDL